MRLPFSWTTGLLALMPLLPLGAGVPPAKPGDLLELGPVEVTPARDLVADFQARVVADLGALAKDFEDFGPQAVFRQMLQDHLTDQVPSRAIKYASEDSHGHPRTYSGRVFLPTREAGAPPLALPLVVYQHGTETRRTFTPYYRKGSETMFGALAANIGGFAVAMPDGDGMGADPSPEMHAYCHGATGAKALIDCLQAALGQMENGDAIFDNKNYVWDGRIFVVGYSEGGYIALAAVKELASNPAYKDIKLTGAACMGGPFNLAKFTRDMLTETKTPYERPYIPVYFLAAWEQIYPGQVSFAAAIHPTLLKPDGKGETVRDWLSGKLGGDQISPRIQAQLTQDPGKAVPAASLLNEAWFQANLKDNSSPLNALLNQSDLVGGWAPTVPVLLAHDPFDPTVAYSNSKAVYDDWSRRGANPIGIIDLAVSGKGSGHVGGAILSIPAAFTWISAGMPTSLAQMAKDQIRAQIIAQAPQALHSGAEALATALGERQEDQPLLPLSRIQGTAPFKVTFNDYFAVVGKVKFYTLSATPRFPGQQPVPGTGGFTQLVKEMRKKGDTFDFDPRQPCYMAVYPQEGFVGLTLKFAGGAQGNYTINIKQALKNKILSQKAPAYFTLSDNFKPRVNPANFENIQDPQPFIALP